MGDKTTILQNYSPANANGDYYDFFFVIDTCERLQSMTGFKTCKSETESQAVLESLYVDTQIQTMYWNVKNFMRNAHNMNSEFTRHSVQLNSAVFQRQAYTLIP